METERRDALVPALKVDEDLPLLEIDAGDARRVPGVGGVGLSGCAEARWDGMCWCWWWCVCLKCVCS